MITARFKFAGDIITGFNISGHSGSAEKGSDIICSAVSSPAIMVANTITEIMCLNPSISEKDGFLNLSLTESEAIKAADILNGFILHLTELSKQYPKYILVERGAK